MRGQPRLLLALVAVATLSAPVGGCAVPFVIPPAKLSGGMGPSGGTLRPTIDDPPAATSLAGAWSTRLGVHPLSAFPEQLYRRWDIGVGWVHEGFMNRPEATQVDGAYLEGGVFLWGRRTGADSVVRVAAVGQAELLFEDAFGPLQIGYGGAVGFNFEWAWFTEGVFADDGGDVFLIGAASGELAFGVGAEAAYRVIDDERWWHFQVHLSMRLPAMAGIAIGFPR